ncbi:winged helix-turn-helix domain-containing protein [Kitasatospora sp. NPDC057936]|uniref:winged helix-turn-helix domain-containing protein n=1 Tax=Kitasatospora sp. NPDC057936 TaxID=3346283 RepID=UPI0036DB58FC
MRARALAGLPLVDRAGIVYFRGRQLPLSGGEAGLLRLLLASFQSVVTRAEITAHLWPGNEQCRRNALDIRVLRTRRRVAPMGILIKTVRDKGYLLELSTGIPHHFAQSVAPGARL